MTNKVFGLGLPRSGTTSLHEVLLQLGLRSLPHSIDLYRSPSDAIFEEYDAFSDTPVPLIYRQLDQKLPNSRFILTRRPKAAWLKSMEWLLTDGAVRWFHSFTERRYHRELFGTEVWNESVLSDFYDRYHSEVAAYFEGRPADLYTIDIADGLDVSSLCDFLELEPRPVSLERHNERVVPSVTRRAAYWMYLRTVRNERNDRVLRRSLGSIGRPILRRL